MRLEVVFSMMLYTGAAGYDEHTSRGLREVGAIKETTNRRIAKGVGGVAYALVVAHGGRRRETGEWVPCSTKSHRVVRKILQVGVPLLFLGGAINNELAHRRAR